MVEGVNHLDLQACFLFRSTNSAHARFHKGLDLVLISDQEHFRTRPDQVPKARAQPISEEPDDAPQATTQPRYGFRKSPFEPPAGPRFTRPSQSQVFRHAEPAAGVHDSTRSHLSRPEQHRRVHRANSPRREPQRCFQHLVAAGTKSEKHDLPGDLGRDSPRHLEDVIDRIERVHRLKRHPGSGRTVTKSGDVVPDTSKPFSCEAAAELHPQAAWPDSMLVRNAHENTNWAPACCIALGLDAEQPFRAEPDASLSDEHCPAGWHLSRARTAGSSPDDNFTLGWHHDC